MNKREDNDQAGRQRPTLDQRLEEPTTEHCPTLAELSEFAFTAKSGTELQAYVDLACSMYDTRRLRTRFLSPSVLGEPVWDMLLALYCFTARGEVLSVSGLCQAAEVPTTTALRWIHLLEQKKLIDRSKDSRDARRAFISLSPSCKQMMTDYLAAVHKRINEEEASADASGPSVAFPLDFSI
jgi:DNA-binding MarR family transcriptional regulator